MQVDAEAQYYIISAISDSLAIKTIHCETAKDLWKAICTEHEWKMKIFRMEMTRRIYNERCTDVHEVRVHITKMVRLREALAATGEILDDADFAFILINSLPDSYSVVASIVCTTAIMCDQPLNIQQIIAVAEIEYARRQISNEGLPGASTALLTNPRGPSSLKRGKGQTDVQT